MGFSVHLFAVDPQLLRGKLARDVEMVDEIRRRQTSRGDSAETIAELCARVSAVRSLNWPARGDMLSVHAFLCMLGYAAEPIMVARLQGVRYSSLVDEVPLLGHMVAERGPLPIPDTSGLDCEIGFLEPSRLRELAERGPPACPQSDLDVGTELVEVFESLAADNLGLYTIINGAKLRRERRSGAVAAQWPGMAELRNLITALVENIDEDDTVEREIDRQLLDGAEDGDLDKVRALLEKGADVNAQRRDGYTPLLLALGEGHNDVCRVLLDAGARVDTTIYNGSSAMHVAASGGNLEGLELLHSQGGSVDTRRSDGATPLLNASLEAAAWLLNHGADVNAGDNDGWTALHDAYARSVEFEEQGLPSPFVALLEKHGADVTIKDNQGRMPKDFPVR